jgi:hypothetical protein
MDDVLKVKWYLHEHNETVIGVSGYPETFYTCYVSTAPKKGEGYKLATMQRWVGGPQYNGFVEQAVGRDIVERHNASLEKKTEAKIQIPSPETVAFSEKVRGKSGPKKGHMPSNLKNLARWPKGIARKQPDGSFITLQEALERKRLQDEKEEPQPLVQTPENQSDGIIQQEQPVQAETNPPEEKIQPQALSSSALGGTVKEDVNVLPSPLPAST